MKCGFVIPVYNHGSALEDNVKNLDSFNYDIIIVDDSITLGNTIMESCKIISECYTPKSITILTLLSPLYCEDGIKLTNL